MVVGASVAEDEDFTYISLFAGIEAASEAWHHMGWKPICFADIDAFPSAVLAHHYPDVPNVGDVTKVDWNEYEGKADLIVGGSPCQSFSVAGKRLGMDDPRGNLAIEFCRVVERVKPTWFVFENVAGLLSSDEGRDFGTLLELMGECGYGIAYRILDAKNFGVPQRRRRVFVIGHSSGDWRRPAAVLFEPKSLHRNLTESQAKGQTDTGSVGEGVGASSESERSRGMNWDGSEQTGTLTASHHRQRMPDKDNFFGVIQDSVPDQGIQEDGIPYQSDTVTAKWSKGADLPLQFNGSKEKGTGNIIPVDDPNPDVAGCITTNIYHKQGFDNQTVNTPGHLIVEDDDDPISIQGDGSNAFAQQNGCGISEDPLSYTLTKREHHSVAQFTAFDHKNAQWIDTASAESTPPATVEGGLAVSQPIHSFDPAFGYNARVFDDVAPTLKVNGLVPTSPAVGQEIEIDSIAIRTGGDYADPTIHFDDNVFLAANPMSDRKMAIGQRTIYRKSKNAQTDQDDEVWEESDPESATTNTLTTWDIGDVRSRDIVVEEDTQTALHDPSNPIDAHYFKGPGERAGGERNIVAANREMVVRRLTPVECERLQGFPDNYTQIAWKGKTAENCPDSLRYKAIGNSMAVPVMRWLGEGIEAVHELPIAELPPDQDGITSFKQGVAMRQPTMDSLFD